MNLQISDLAAIVETATAVGEIAGAIQPVIDAVTSTTASLGDIARFSSGLADGSAALGAGSNDLALGVNAGLGSLTASAGIPGAVTSSADGPFGSAEALGGLSSTISSALGGLI